MTNWKDIVMTDEQIMDLVGFISNNYRKIAQAQAEISFRAGIKEVAEWIKTEKKCRYINDVLYYPVYEKALETKLKEWGIDEKTNA